MIEMIKNNGIYSGMPHVYAICRPAEIASAEY